MQELTQYGQRLVHTLAQRYGFSTDAVTTLLHAIITGDGTQAQFYHPELGGSGQWMQGGSVMLGDMFDDDLKASVDGVCQKLASAAMSGSALLNPKPVLPASVGNVSESSHANNIWWPEEWGLPSHSGSQNNVRYAIFPAARRLALDIGGHLKFYDTLDHQITGLSQQHSANDESWTFDSQYGVIPVGALPGIGIDESAHLSEQSQDHWP